MTTSPIMQTGAAEAPQTIKAQIIDTTSFARYGDLLEAAGDPDFMINDGACGRFHDRARLSVDAAGHLGVSLFDSRRFDPPVTVSFVERHPLGSQTFIPMSADPFLVVVASDRDGVPDRPRAFMTRPGQGINLLRGTWHGVLTPLGANGLFAVIDRIGPGENCEVYTYPRPFIVEVER